MMKAWLFTLASLFTLSLCYGHSQLSAVAPDSKEMSIVSGKVFYRNGDPASDALVDVHIFAAFQGILPPAVRTDIHGRYTLIYRALGKGYIEASKPEEGFPDPVVALYHDPESSSFEIVDLRPGARLTNVDLHLAEALPSVEFSVEDAVNGTAIANARMLAHRKGEPAAMISTSIAETGSVTLLLPLHALEVVISAPGYEDWKWSSADNRETQIKKASKSERVISVKLVRQGKEK